MTEMNRKAYGRINWFLRKGNNRGKEFTAQEIAENTELSLEEVKLTIEMVMKDEVLFAGGPSIVKAEKPNCFCCRAKYLDKPQGI